MGITTCNKVQMQKQNINEIQHDDHNDNKQSNNNKNTNDNANMGNEHKNDSKSKVKMKEKDKQKGMGIQRLCCCFWEGGIVQGIQQVENPENIQYKEQSACAKNIKNAKDTIYSKPIQSQIVIIQPIKFQINNHNPNTTNPNMIQTFNKSQENTRKPLSKQNQSKYWIFSNLCSKQNKQVGQLNSHHSQQGQNTDRCFIKTGSTQEKQQSSEASPKFVDIRDQDQVQNKEQILQRKQKGEENNGQKDKSDIRVNSFSPGDGQAEEKDLSPIQNRPMKKLIIKCHPNSETPLISRYMNGTQVKIQKLEIPFQIIKLSLNSHLVSALQTHNPQFFQKFNDKDNLRNKNWRILKNGMYCNLLDNVFGIFVSSDIFYEGYFVENIPSYTNFTENKNKIYMHVPDQSGLYIDKAVVYKGQIHLGKAHGKGRLMQRNGKQQIFDGKWVQGMLTQGKYQCQNINYYGQFYNCKPSGLGTLKIKNKGVVYKGYFVDGKFQDQNGVYQCEQWIYQGGFQAGKKMGRGALTNDKQGLLIQGQWRQDKVRHPIIRKL